MTRLIHEFLTQNAKNFGDKVAVVYKHENITYRELEIESNKLANRLVELGLQRGSRIGIYMDKSIQMAVSIYGSLKANCVYVPMDPLAPTQRLASIVNDCDIHVILSSENKSKGIFKLIPELRHPIKVIGVSDFSSGTSLSWQWVNSCVLSAAPGLAMSEDEPAYIIYTSGSTGQPKGILHSHQSCLSFATWGVKTINVGATDKLGNHCPLHFDISTFDWFAALIAGACVVLIPEEYVKMPSSYASLLTESEITVLYTVPYALIQFAQLASFTGGQLPDLRDIIFAGEPMPIKHLRQLLRNLPNTRFHNWYGPAETNVCTHYTVGQIDDDMLSLPIGSLCSFAEAKIVDSNQQRNQQEVAREQTGELWIHSSTTMNAYWARPELNQEIFVEVKEDGISKRYYKTGDLVMRDEDGLLWFAGRKDRQVKIRGYRVELDEIEAALLTHASVEEAAVVCLPASIQTTRNVAQSNTLFAAYTSSGKNHIPEKILIKHMKSLLPSYAVPASIIYIEQLPRTSTGKIDRHKLEKEVSLDCVRE